MAEPAFTVPDELNRRQRRASDPAASSWVRAHAGAGKTYVLAQRVLRLLLAGSDPARILCITYTRAAAAEMANRVFDWLGQWTRLDDVALAQTLTELNGRPPSKNEMARARTLFAEAIETPGRLRIQTIHAFCERLLQQFPFEASVTAGFQVVDERAAAELLAEARAGVLREEARPGGRLAGDLARLVATAGDDTLDKLLAEALSRKAELAAWMADGEDEALELLAAALGLAPGDSAEALAEKIIDGPVLSRGEWPEIAAWLAGGSTNDGKAADRLAAAHAAAGDGGLDDYCAVFLTGAGAPRKAVVTRALAASNPVLAERLEREKIRVSELCGRLKAASIHTASAALFRLADAVIGRYERLKGARGLVDYDDLIARAAMLLTRADAAWVLYKLDGGLDHVLVDEAQDTAPRQWQVIEAVIHEFFAGESARQAGRTVFAVGDEKQSIYSFQGADPAGFAAMRRTIAGRAADAGQRFGEEQLTLSFRSTPAVLEAVDAVFANPGAAAALVEGGDIAPHEAIRADARGRVELWEVVKPDPRDEPPPWDAPFDIARETTPEARLADRIARTIRRWLEGGEFLEATGAPIRAGDVMILLRNRQPFVGPMVRALKANDVPVAGADRLLLTEHIAVMDLMALGRFCLMPDDDLTLAALLKSPLVGLDEERLMEIAIGRPGSLWQALGSARHEPYSSAAAQLRGWRARAAGLRPYDFYAGILGAGRMRRAFHRRLGAEAFEAIDEFLSLALDFERAETPTLQGFLHWLDAAPSEVKRDMDKGRDEVRVMTVHGAKGLEAPIVFLPDTCRMPDGRHVGPLFAFAAPDPGPPLVWVPRKDDDCDATRTLREAALERQREEDLRLLYVAMTRARDRLYVCGFEGLRARREDCWYELVRNALTARLEPLEDADGIAVHRLMSALPPAVPRDADASEDSRGELPPWIEVPSPAEAIAQRRAPSHLAEHAAPPSGSPSGDTGERRLALRRGSLIHRLLELLPSAVPSERAAAGARILTALAPDWDDAMRHSLLSEVLAILDDPVFAAAFAPDSRAEVAVAGRLDGLDGTVIGQIDRLAVGESGVLVVDYKTDRIVPAAAEAIAPAYLAQMAAYAALAAGLHPGKPVRVAILWTAAPALMEIPPGLLAAHGRPAPA